MKNKAVAGFIIAVVFVGAAAGYAAECRIPACVLAPSVTIRQDVLQSGFEKGGTPSDADVFALIEWNLAQVLVIPEQAEAVQANLRDPVFRQRFGGYIRDIFEQKNIAVYCSRRINWEDEQELTRLEVFFRNVNAVMLNIPDAFRKKTTKTFYFDVHSAQDFYDIFELTAEGFSWDMNTNYGFGVNVSNFDNNALSGGSKSSDFDVALVAKAIVHELVHKMITVRDDQGKSLLSRDAWRAIANIIDFDLRDNENGRELSDQEFLMKIRENDGQYYTVLKEYIAYAVGGITDDMPPMILYDDSFSLTKIKKRLRQIKSVLQQEFLRDTQQGVVWDFRNGTWHADHTDTAGLRHRTPRDIPHEQKISASI